MTTAEYLKLDPKKDKKEIKRFNKDLVEKYPWLIPGRSEEDPIQEGYDYTYTSTTHVLEARGLANSQTLVD